ncbi:hypothetical protein PVAP13_3KG050594 [Panicum virgatum]|uniref:Uncharacterized protein n=1 Tax=Panicum virgatum TaxID=38727 RepID=A0A8T0UK02_PANVG|nr:hypothetical protein PVAP13_3KG050594 [Panicum virgatum]
MAVTYAQKARVYNLQEASSTLVCLFMACAGNFEFIKASIILDLVCQPKCHIQKSILPALHPLALSCRLQLKCSDMNNSAHLL